MPEGLITRLFELSDNISRLCAEGIMGNARATLIAISAENEALKKELREFSVGEADANMD